jgi:hypothetical protein
LKNSKSLCFAEILIGDLRPGVEYASALPKKNKNKIKIKKRKKLLPLKN